MSDAAESDALPPRRIPWGHLFALTAWVAIFAALYLYFDARLKPRVAVASGAALAQGEVVIPRSPDGHYYVAGAINGQPVTFLVDTGASTVSVSRAFARQAGLPKGTPADFQTAGGPVSGEMVSGVSVEAAGIRVDGISVGVGIHSADRQAALLGQNFLRKVELVQSGDRMIFRLRKAGD